MAVLTETDRDVLNDFRTVAVFLHDRSLTLNDMIEYFDAAGGLKERLNALTPEERQAALDEMGWDNVTWQQFDDLAFRITAGVAPEVVNYRSIYAPARRLR